MDSLIRSLIFQYRVTSIQCNSSIFRSFSFHCRTNRITHIRTSIASGYIFKRFAINSFFPMMKCEKFYRWMCGSYFGLLNYVHSSEIAMNVDGEWQWDLATSVEYFLLFALAQFPLELLIFMQNCILNRRSNESFWISNDVFASFVCVCVFVRLKPLENEHLNDLHFFLRHSFSNQSNQRTFSHFVDQFDCIFFISFIYDKTKMRISVCFNISN